MCPFPENYVPLEVTNKLTLNEPAISNRAHVVYTSVNEWEILVDTR